MSIHVAMVDLWWMLSFRLIHIKSGIIEIAENTSFFLANNSDFDTMHTFELKRVHFLFSESYRLGIEI